jgi:PAS domain-containing protein
VRERNQLLHAAGYAPVYSEAGLEAADAALVKTALQRMLAVHEPYPAVVLDRYWNIVDRNEAARALFGWLLGDRDAGTGNLVLNIFGPLRSYVANWDEAAEMLLQRVHREAVGGVPDARTTALLEEALAFPGVPPAWRVPDLGRPLLPVVPVRFRRDGRTLSYFSAVTTLGTAQDALLQEIRVESLCPADAETASAGLGAGSR